MSFNRSLCGFIETGSQIGGENRIMVIYTIPEHKFCRWSSVFFFIIFIFFNLSMLQLFEFSRISFVSRPYFTHQIVHYMNVIVHMHVSHVQEIDNSIHRYIKCGVCVCVCVLRIGTNAFKMMVIQAGIVCIQFNPNDHFTVDRIFMQKECNTHSQLLSGQTDS